MNRVIPIIFFTLTFIFSSKLSYSQKNIGEFNRNEETIYKNIDKEFKALHYNSGMQVEEYNKFSVHAKQIIAKCEERIQKCKTALTDLSEIPSKEIKSNIEFKSWTEESIIWRYTAIVKTLNSNITSLERNIKSVKEEAAKKTQEKESNKISSSSKQNIDNFWSEDNSTISRNPASSSLNSKSSNEDFVSDSKFSHSLAGLKEGEFFIDDKGQHYQKTAGGARKVDKYSFEKAQVNKIAADFSRKETERKRVESAALYATNVAVTSFYAMQNAHKNLKDATNLNSNFDNIEDLNYAFTQKLREVSQMGNELKATSIQSTQNYARAITAANATTASDYAYGEALSSIGGIAAGISADNEEKKARAALREQRDAQEKSIKARQLNALINIRKEIGNMFPEGGMPLSSHKIDVPVLYLFAYTSNKNEWILDTTVPMTVSNVIPVYRYSDGTYPYISTVKKTFENAGLSNPLVVGYFTDHATAEKYQQSLVEISNQGRFNVTHVLVKVRETEINSNKSNETDFWGTPIKKEKSQTEKKEDNFWK